MAGNLIIYFIDLAAFVPTKFKVGVNELDQLNVLMPAIGGHSPQIYYPDSTGIYQAKSVEGKELYLSNFDSGVEFDNGQYVGLPGARQNGTFPLGWITKTKHLWGKQELKDGLLEGNLLSDVPLARFILKGGNAHVLHFNEYRKPINSLVPGEIHQYQFKNSNQEIIHESCMVNIVRAVIDIPANGLELKSVNLEGSGPKTTLTTIRKNAEILLINNYNNQDDENSSVHFMHYSKLFKGPVPNVSLTRDSNNKVPAHDKNIFPDIVLDKVKGKGPSAPKILFSNPILDREACPQVMIEPSIVII